MADTIAEARPAGLNLPPGSGWQRTLAAAVIRLALEDLVGATGSQRHTAETFFRPASPDLRFWAAVAGIDSQVVAERAQARLHRTLPLGRCA